jgi:tetratricopeptide (TPR) repeat protein
MQMKENPSAYPRLLLQDDRLSDEAPLSRAFHERFPAHLVGLRGADGGVWPEPSQSAQARAQYNEGHRLLYEEKDPIAAMRCYEAAIDLDPEYIQPWVALGIAGVMDNTPESLALAEGVFSQLSELGEDSGLSGELRSMIRQNLAYISVHRYRESGLTTELEKADAGYIEADALAEQERVELLCPWAFVKCERGEDAIAAELWTRAMKAAPSRDILLEYAAKYAPLRRFFEGDES